jgi:hypothetical protein
MSSPRQWELVRTVLHLQHGGVNSPALGVPTENLGYFARYDMIHDGRTSRQQPLMVNRAESCRRGSGSGSSSIPSLTRHGGVFYLVALLVMMIIFAMVC